jgi:FkbM family methyltransferase
MSSFCQAALPFFLLIVLYIAALHSRDQVFTAQKGSNSLFSSNDNLVELDCGSVPVPEGANCFWTDCASGDCSTVCMNPSSSYGPDVIEVIRRDYAWSWAFWRVGGIESDAIHSKRAFMLDIGANIGLTLLGAARSGRRVLAFEPAPINTRYLNASICLSGCEKLVEVVSAAVGAQSGVARFVEHSARGDNSAMNAQTAGLNIGGATQEIEVPMWSIDDYVVANPRWKAEDCALMKVDVQGFELRVFEGARTFLQTAALANKFFTVRAEIDARLELSSLGKSGEAEKFMAGLEFEVFGRDGNDVIWKPKQQIYG